MPVISLRYTPSDLAPIRAFAHSRGLPLSSAIKQLAEEALQARQKPPAESFAEADRRLLRQALQLQRMSFLFLHAHYGFSRIHQGRHQDEFDSAQLRTNAYLDQNPDLYVTARFTVPAKPAAPAKA